MNTPLREHPIVKVHQQRPTPDKAPEPSNAVLLADRVSSALACVYLARAALTFACCAAAERLRSSGSSRIRGWPFWTRCPTSTDRSRIFPPTRKPRSPCTRASTIPVKVLRVEPAASALKTSTLGDCRRGSFTACLAHPPAIKATVSDPASRPMAINDRRSIFTKLTSSALASTHNWRWSNRV
jgi:hypothetical protein